MTLWKQALLVGIGGFAGAVARWAIASIISRGFGSSFPLGVLVINITGSFSLGMLVGWAASRSGGSDTVWLAGAVGFLGAYTTFSTFAVDTDQLLRDGFPARAALNIIASVVLGLIAARTGYLFTR